MPPPTAVSHGLQTRFLLPPSNPPARKVFSIQILPFSGKLSFLRRSLPSPRSLQSSFQPKHQFQLEQLPDDEEDDCVIGDHVVFEEGIFEGPYRQPESDSIEQRPKFRKSGSQVNPEDLIPDRWKGALAEINMSKKERRATARELEFGTRIFKKKQAAMPLRDVNSEEYLKYREAKMALLKPVVLDTPKFQEEANANEVQDIGGPEAAGEMKAPSGRVSPRNPRRAVYGGTLDDITEFFNSSKYNPSRGASSASSGGGRKLFTKEEKLLLNRHTPDLAAASSGKWLPLHTLAASGEFLLLDALLKHNVNINGVDKDGLSALQRAIIANKLAITNYLLRESANPFVCDNDGATLMHYAVQAASIPAIKVLLLYNVDINRQDNDGWTPLHVAVQTRRTDIVRLLLIKGAHVTLKNRDGLTPVELCLYSGQDLTTYRLIKLLKQVPHPVKNFYQKPIPAVLRLPENPHRTAE